MRTSHRRVEDADREELVQRVLTCQATLVDLPRPPGDDGVECALDDRVDDRLRREVRTQLMAPRRLLQHQAASLIDELPGEEALVHRAQGPDGEVAVVHVCSIDPVDAVECWAEERVGHASSFQPGVLFGIEEAAVVFGNAQRGIAAIDGAEERAQVREEAIVGG